MLALTAAVLSAQEASTWHRTLKDGLKAARSSGRPVLVVTLWEKGT